MLSTLTSTGRARPRCRTCGEPMLGHKKGLICYPPRESSALSEESDESNSRHQRSSRERPSFATPPLPSPSPTPSEELEEVEVGSGGASSAQPPRTPPRTPRPLARSPPRYPYDPLVPDEWEPPEEGNVRRVNPYLMEPFRLVNKDRGTAVEEDEDADKENSSGGLTRHSSWTPTEIVSVSSEWLTRLTPPRSPSPAPTVRANRKGQRNATAGPSTPRGMRNRASPASGRATDAPDAAPNAPALPNLPVQIESIIRAAGRYQTRVVAFIPSHAGPPVATSGSLNELNYTICRADDIALGMVLITDGRPSLAPERVLRWLWDWLTKGLTFLAFALLVWYIYDL